jgi:predicted nucleic acid-binding protein
MLLLDVNVLVYAFREGAPGNTAYRDMVRGRRR